MLRDIFHQVVNRALFFLEEVTLPRFPEKFFGLLRCFVGLREGCGLHSCFTKELLDLQIFLKPGRQGAELGHQELVKGDAHLPQVFDEIPKLFLPLFRLYQLEHRAP